MSIAGISCMSRTLHKWRKFVFKCTFTVIGIVLFTAQVSYKFYQYASLPLFHGASIRHAAAGGHFSSSVFARHRGKAFLTIDKRYDYEAFIGLIPATFRISRLTGDGRILHSITADNILPGKFEIPPLRG